MNLIDVDVGSAARVASLDDLADLGHCVKSNPGLSRDCVLICLILISLSMAESGGEKSVLKRAGLGVCALCLSHSADYPERRTEL